METQTLRIEEAARILGIGRSSAYAAAKRGRNSNYQNRRVETRSETGT